MRYVLHPGLVRSAYDSDIHFIGMRKLAELYGVKMEDCVLHKPKHHLPRPGDIHLRPRLDGNYTLPTPTEIP